MPDEFDWTLYNYSKEYPDDYDIGTELDEDDKPASVFWVIAGAILSVLWGITLIGIAIYIAKK